MSRITGEYAEFKTAHQSFIKGERGARGALQEMFPVNREGAIKLMLFWSASCLNFGSSCRTRLRKKFDEVLVNGWDSPDKFQKYCERLGKMGINMFGGYEGNDKDLVFIEVEGTRVEKAGPKTYAFLPMFKCWFEEVVDFANEIYPSGNMETEMKSIHSRAVNGGGDVPAQSLKEMLEAAKPSRDSATHRVKGKVPELGMQYTGEQLSEEELVARLKEKQATLARAFGMGPEGLKKFAETKHDDHIDMQKYTIKQEDKTMSKTNDFISSVKSVFGVAIRMQRGRATVHAVKRVIFKAFPIQWGILARLTGKAKKVEDHPLTDVAVALLAHGAANALLTDPKKRDKYLCYTEEMVAASVANAGLKMVPVEDILDKVLNGAMDSEAINKLKAVLKDQDQ